MLKTKQKIDTLSFEKVFYFPEHLRSLVNDENAYPVHMQVGTTNFCNHDCTFCFASRSMFDKQSKPMTRIDVDRFMDIVEEMREMGLRAITLVGTGEPTLHPKIADIIYGIKERGVEVGMFTNGSCMTERTARAIAECMTFCRFSLTGASEEVHDLVHANNDYNRVIENIKKVVSYKQGNFPTLGTQLILASYSAPDVIRGARLARDMGMDYYEIKPAYVAPDKPDQLPNNLSVETANELIEEAKKFETDSFKVFGKVEQMEKVFVNIDDRSYDDCPGHKTTAVLEADLNLYICVNHKIPEYSFGNLSNNSFKEIWHGERRRQILDRLNVHECIPRCRQDPINRIVQEIRIGDRTIPLNTPIPDPNIHPNFI